MPRLPLVAALLLTLGLPAGAAAQGRVMGVVLDVERQPIKGAIVRATNPEVSSHEVTSTTDEKGRFVMLGLRLGGSWKFVAEAPGYFSSEGVAPVRSNTTAPVSFVMRRDPGPMPNALMKDVADQIAAASALHRQGRYDQAIAAYQSIQGRNPKLTSVHMVLAALYRERAAQETNPAAREALLRRAASAYGDMLKADAENRRAQQELAAVTAVLGTSR